MLESLQKKYLNSHLRYSVMDIKNTYETLMLHYEGIKLEYQWFNKWYKKVGDYFAHDFDMEAQLVKLWNGYLYCGTTIEEYINEDLLQQYDELAVAYFQSYMVYKVRGIVYENKVFEELKKFCPLIKETTNYEDRMFKVDLRHKRIGIQVKNYNFTEYGANKFYRKAKKWNRIDRYIWYGNDGCFEYIKGTWTKVNIEEVIICK